MDTPHTHLITFTGNPLAETTLDFESWAPGRTQRARSSTFQMGGKGINVAKMLRRLGAPTTALTFLGAASGAQCAAWLEARGFSYVAAATAAATRSGLVVRAPGAAETTFLGPDSPPDAEAWNAAAAALGNLERQHPRCALAFCGSSPGWTTPEAASFRSALDAWLGRGRPLYVDTYGPPLAWFVERPVDLIKINADELRALTGRSDPIEALLAPLLRRSPASAWIVSDGAGPVWFGRRGETPRSLQPPSIREVSATGSGDVLLACLLHASLNLGLSWDEALAYALPQASANAAHPGIAEF